MYRSGHVRAFLTVAAVLLSTVASWAPAIGSSASDPRFPTAGQNSPQADNGSTSVRLRWGARPGVSRYRLQLARTPAFDDIVFDRVVAGAEYRIVDLEPGRYFWRIAPLTSKLGEYSSTGIVDVSPVSKTSDIKRPASSNDSSRSAAPARNSIVVADGWRAAIGDVSRPVLARLRSPGTFDLVVVNHDGVTFALDAVTGVALWTARPRMPRARNGAPLTTPLLLKSRAGLDNVIVASGSTVTAYEGRSGRQLWTAALPAPAAGAVAVSDARSAEIFILDNTLQRLLLLDGNTGSLIAQARLSHRAVGSPVLFDYQGTRGVMIAFADGGVEILDRRAVVVRAGDTGSPATTPPLFVNGPREALVLVGTRGGLTALSADKLHALGRIAIKDGAPRGILNAEDLDGDGIAEVIMLTDHNRAVAVNAADGKVIWQADTGDDAGTVAFADLNGDHVLDVLMAGQQTFAFALSGRDGSVVWKYIEQTGSVANHAVSGAPRSVVAVPYGSGILLVGGDTLRAGLRAVGFPKGAMRPGAR